MPPEPNTDYGARPWREQGLCRAYNPELWYINDGTEGDGYGSVVGATPTDNARYKATARSTAVQVCRRCPVREKCLQWALEHQERHGIWGGLLPAERKRLLGIAAWSRPTPELVHGTEAGARQHRRAGQLVCDACLRAERAASAERKQQRSKVAS